MASNLRKKTLSLGFSSKLSSRKFLMLKLKKNKVNVKIRKKIKILLEFP